ncbi:hypothetical protein OG884_24025 [Streptosporangium sp. NBC_01755]|uniref:hypothetical protein n=1 Tax=unclassified Streptosporangium TaxID=2632669 RepID=UPI002DDBE8C6|nr:MULTISPECIES: hypothetical protein [unclassified Streptosporangium]WSA23976.1 hypothetical protein OIE13_23885 [Streptosporangium sp. NBC_01810]WSC97948.1 hypothetical protein OG884_24025 [Streptosporangium sp. NBC_01755]
MGGTAATLLDGIVMPDQNGAGPRQPVSFADGTGAGFGKEPSWRSVGDCGMLQA